MSRCIPCELKRQRLQYKLTAVRQRAVKWAQERRLTEIAIYTIHDDDGDDTYSFAATAPDGADVIEYLSVQLP